MQSPINQTPIPVGLYGSLTSDDIKTRLEVLAKKKEELEKNRADMINKILTSMLERDRQRLAEGSDFQKTLEIFFEKPRDNKDCRDSSSSSWTYPELGMFWNRNWEHVIKCIAELINNIKFEDGILYGSFMKSNEGNNLKALKEKLDELFKAESEQMNTQVVINDKNPLPEEQRTYWNVNNFYQHVEVKIKLHEERRKEIKQVEGEITKVRTQLEELCKSLP